MGEIISKKLKKFTILIQIFHKFYALFFIFGPFPETTMNTFAY
jgi:hypothetical protein